MKEEVIKYTHESVECEGFLAFDETIKTKRPAVLILHTWRGLDDFMKNKAKELAKMGYVGFALDVFGQGKIANNDQDASELIKPFYLDRQLLRERIIAGYQALLKQPMVDQERIGTIGFCFGGMGVVELFLSGTPIKSAVSFHGIFNIAGAKLAPNAKDIKGSLLILHGFDDPMSSHEDVLRIQKELTSLKVDWQMNLYGLTTHAFTNPVANDPSKGLLYNEKSSSRAWLAMKNHFEETL